MQRNLVNSQLAQGDDFDKPFLWLGGFGMKISRQIALQISHVSDYSLWSSFGDLRFLFRTFF